MWGLCLVTMAVLGVATSLPPLVSEPWQVAIMQIFDPLCHQITERSPHISGTQLAVCHRCYGLLIGLAVGPLFMLLLRRWSGGSARILMAVSFLPLSLDWGLDVLGLWTNSAVSRMATGGVFGLMASVLVARGMALRSSLRK